MKFSPPLKQARLIRRYNRFLCDVLLPDGNEVVMYCPNTGSMKNCCFENAPLWYSTSQNTKRKYAHTWEMLENPEGQILSINSGQANLIVKEAIEQGKIIELLNYNKLMSEVKYGQENSRIDILLESEGEARTYIEVKSVTLFEDDGWGYFPDSVSVRGQKHLRELMHIAKAGHRAILFFCIQHSGITQMKPASHIDPCYAALLSEANASGVEILAYGCELNASEITISYPVYVSM